MNPNKNWNFYPWMCFPGKQYSVHCYALMYQVSFSGGASDKEPACQCWRHKETQVQFLGWEDPLEKGMATHSSVLTWRIPWTEESSGLQSIGLHRFGHDWSDLARTPGGWCILTFWGGDMETLSLGSSHTLPYMHILFWLSLIYVLFCNNNSVIMSIVLFWVLWLVLLSC